MKITKKPKKVKVDWFMSEIVVYRSSYECPVCKIEFQNTLKGNVTRFFCDCGQELIAKRS